MVINTGYVSSWKSKELSDESLTPALNYYGTKTSVKLTGKQPKVSYTHGTIVNIYIAYELGASDSHTNDCMLKSCLFGGVRLTKNADSDKYGYSGFGIGFDRRSKILFPGGGFGQM